MPPKRPTSPAAAITLAETACAAQGIALASKRTVRPVPFGLGRLTGWRVRAHPPGVVGGGWVTVRISRDGAITDVHVSPR
jgi:hypothetical protein